MSDIEARIDHLEQLEAIRRLKHHTYCRCVDRVVAGDTGARAEISAHLCEDVVADFTGFPLMEGRAAVETFLFEHVPSVLAYSQHRVMNDVIDRDGDTATALWYLDCPVVFRDGNALGIHGSAMIAGRYEERYRREDGVWKFHCITALLDTVKAFAENWNGAVQLETNR